MVAFRLLAERIDATQEEIAAWVFFGPESGGLDGYIRIHDGDDDLANFRQFSFSEFEGEHDYRTPLTQSWFLRRAIEEFNPPENERYLTGPALLQRWRNVPGTSAAAYIRAKIEESTLMDFHPTCGGTQAAYQDDLELPPFEEALFSMEHIINIENEEFPGGLIEHIQTAEAPEVPVELPMVKLEQADSVEGFELSTSNKTGVFPFPPEKKDDWYLAIVEAVNALSVQLGRMPNMQETWTQLRNEPPVAFGVTHGKKGREFALLLDGDKTLTKSALRERWKRYTTGPLKREGLGSDQQL